MTSTFSTFRRLLHDFAKPYTKRLCVGVGAGFLVGGSLFLLLGTGGEVLHWMEEPPEGVSAEGKTTNSEPGNGHAMPASPEAKLGLLGKAAKRLGIPLTHDDGSITWQFTLLAGLTIALLALVRNTATFLNRYCLRWVGTSVVKDLRDALFKNLQKQSLAFYGKSDVGKLISRCTYDTTMIESAISKTVGDLCRAPIEVAAVTVYIIIAARKNGLVDLTLLLFLVFPICILPIVVLGRYVKRYARRALKRISLLVSRMQENFTGIRVVKAYNMEEYETERFGRMNKQYFSALIKALRAELLMTPLMEFVGVACGCAFLVLCQERGVKLYQIVPMGAAAFFAYRPLKQIAKINVAMQRSMAAAERIFEILDTDTSLPEAEHPVAVGAFADRIVFDKVNFAYDEAGLRVLSDVSLEIPKGSVVAFVGETGSGKTTVANLLARFYDPTDGRIVLDGHDLRELEVASLRRLIGIVTQETIIFNDTIASNISYGTANATVEQIQAAAQKWGALRYPASLTGSNPYNVMMSYSALMNPMTRR